jgi:hypothetical protein
MSTSHSQANTSLRRCHSASFYAATAAAVCTTAAATVANDTAVCTATVFRTVTTAAFQASSQHCALHRRLYTANGSHKRQRPYMAESRVALPVYA